MFYKSMVRKILEITFLHSKLENEKSCWKKTVFEDGTKMKPRRHVSFRCRITIKRIDSFPRLFFFFLKMFYKSMVRNIPTVWLIDFKFENEKN